MAILELDSIFGDAFNQSTVSRSFEANASVEEGLSIQGNDVNQ